MLPDASGWRDIPSALLPMAMAMPSAAAVATIPTTMAAAIAFGPVALSAAAAASAAGAASAALADRTNSPHRNGFLGAYLFGVGSYVFLGTLFELLGLQAISTAGTSISLPAPLSDINAAISVGCMSYLVILGGGIRANKLRGAANTLKDFSLPISMSFRLFGALLSGLLVTELVYYSLSLSFVLPVFVGVMFTLLHALIQTYVLTTLVSIFYGEVTEPHVKIKKVKQTA